MKSNIASDEQQHPAVELATALIDASNAGAAILSQTPGVSRCNARLLDILGLSQEQHACTLERFVPVDETGKAFIQFERFRAGKLKRFSEKCQVNRADGEPHWVDLSLTRLEVPGVTDGLPLTLVSLIDIDRETKALAEIADNQERLEAALEAAGHGMWEFDRRTDTLTLSPGWKKLRGVPVDEDVKMDRDSWLSRVHPDDIERINQTSDQQGQGHDGFDTLEYRERHRDGHYIWIYSRGRPYDFDDTDKPLKVIGTDTDITKLKTIEAELAAQKERLRVTLESIADGVISCDANGTITFMNKSAEQMTDWPAGEAIGCKLSDVFKSVEDSADEKPIDLAGICLRDGSVQHYKNYSKLICRDGRERYIRQSASPLHGMTGANSGAVVVFQDATRSRQQQLDLEYSATHDQLTGLLNRNALETYLDDAISTAREENQEHALLLMDLDHFKAVNDGAGHAAGDALLQTISDIVTGLCKEDDCVARIGGDEFVIVLADRSIKEARIVANRIVDAIAALEFEWHGQVFKVGTSVGVASITRDTNDPVELFKLADAACYEAKRNGRGCAIVGC